jgi:hypothetical protein
MIYNIIKVGILSLLGKIGHLNIVSAGSERRAVVRPTLKNLGRRKELIVSENNEVAMVRTLHLDEMPYDEMVLMELQRIEAELEAGPVRSAFRILAMTVRMDLNRGIIVRSAVMKRILTELERLSQKSIPIEERSVFKTLGGYRFSVEERIIHMVRHDPKEDRWDDCPLCWADVVSEEHMAWLLELGQDGTGNSIAYTMGIMPFHMKGCDDA